MKIDPRAKLFAHLDRLGEWQRGGKPAPVTIEMDLSNRCVLGCMDCHFAHTHQRGPWASKPRTLPMAFDPDLGDLADVSLIERGLAEMAAAGVRAVVFSGGGEPTTHPQWLQIVEHARSCGLEVGMYTLGGLLQPPAASALARLASWVVVSLDAADAGSYAVEKGVTPERFEAACAGLASLARVKSAAIGASFLLQSANWPQAPRMLALARQLGASYATFRPAVRFDRLAPGQSLGDGLWARGWRAQALLASLAGEPDVEIDVERFSEYAGWQGHGYARCGGVRLHATVTPDGRIWLCPNKRGIESALLGDLRRESFATIWARHPGAVPVTGECRVSCRLHLMNQTLAAIEAPREHAAFL